ncbi:helix-turn-helix domain-containing protein [Brevibacterium aurantiacum]|uniref:helix-turn-helix domain-containing protein n=1 Tax=Brevibacterium aurantiacum TaxID=273384 RepID=UPI001D028E76|nr:helix-turn-helix domain-containing protein [Brevibacterium aurantiacum]
MERRVVAQAPAHLLGSVDNALRLLQTLRDTGAVSITDAAADLQVSPSTAHRLLSMLVYRGFAVQDESRIYHPGPGIVANVEAQSAHRSLLQILRPHLDSRQRRRERPAISWSASAPQRASWPVLRAPIDCGSAAEQGRSCLRA